MNLKELGFTDYYKEEENLYKDFHIGRIFSQSKGIYKIMTENGEITGEISGKFRYSIVSEIDYPAIGDFVAIDRNNNDEGNGLIHHRFSRKTAFIRKSAGTSNKNQIVASNIDIVFICMSLNNDFNMRRLERYLAVTWESGAIPVVVLTKSDLCNNIEEKIIELNDVAIGVDILVISKDDFESIDEIRKYINTGKTVAFVGSSGVGKSTIVNNLLGQNILDTKGLRNDDRGRHTTTHREAFILDGGGIVIDTPGMRELGLENVDLSKSFSDIDELSRFCKFSDCSHTNEPKCAVIKAIENGELSEERLISYNKLKKEMNYEGLNSKEIEKKKLDSMFNEFGGMKNARKFLKEKSKRK